MKKIFLLLALTITLGLATAQTYVPIPLDSSTHWRVHAWHSYPGNLCNGEFLYKTDGDTTIGTHTYTTIKRVGFPCIFYGYVPGAIRQDSIARKVYIVPADSVNEEILYDFTQNVGDTLNSVLKDPACVTIVTAVDSVLLNGIYHRQIHFTSNCLFQPERFIEGIGSTYGLLEILMEFETGTDLLCVGHNGEVLYPDSASSCSDVYNYSVEDLPDANPTARLYPNPAGDHVYIDISVKEISECRISILDIIGNHVMADRDFSLSQGNTIPLDIKGLKAGTYVITLQFADGNLITRRFIKIP